MPTFTGGFTKAFPITIAKPDGWIEVLDSAGFIVVKETHEFEFAFVPVGVTIPINSVLTGNRGRSRIIHNIDGTKLYMKATTYTINVTVNVEEYDVIIP